MDVPSASNPPNMPESEEVKSSIPTGQNASRKRPRDSANSLIDGWNEGPNRDKVRVVYPEIGIRHAYDLEVLLGMLSSKHAPRYDDWSNKVSHEEISSILSDREAIMERLSAALAEHAELKAEMECLRESKDNEIKELRETVRLLLSEKAALQEKLEIVDDLSVEQELGIKLEQLRDKDRDQMKAFYEARIAGLEPSPPDGDDSSKNHLREVNAETGEMESAATSTTVNPSVTFGPNYQADFLLAANKAMLRRLKEDFEEAVEFQKALEEELAQFSKRVEILKSGLDQANLARDRSDAELQEARLATQALQTNYKAELEKLGGQLEGSQRSIVIVQADLVHERSLCKQLSAELEALKTASADVTKATTSELGLLSHKATQLQQELDSEKLKNHEFLQDVGSLNARLAKLQVDLQKKDVEEKAYVERISALEQQTEMIQSLDAFTKRAQALEDLFLQHGSTIGYDFLRDLTALLDELAKSELLHAALRSVSFISKAALMRLWDENITISTSLQVEAARLEANIATASARVSELEHSLQKEQDAVMNLRQRLSSERGDFTKEIEELRASRDTLCAELATSRRNYEDIRNSHALLQQRTTAEQSRLREERNEASRGETETRALNAQLLVQLADSRKQYLNLTTTHANCQDTINNYQGTVERLTAEQEDLRQEVATYRSSKESSAALQNELDEVKKQVAAILPLVKKATVRRNRQRSAGSNQGAACSNFNFSELPALPEHNVVGHWNDPKGKGRETSGVLIPIKQVDPKKPVPLTQRVLLYNTPTRSFEPPSPTPSPSRSDSQTLPLRSQTTLTRQDTANNWSQEQQALSVANASSFSRFPDDVPTQPSSPILTTGLNMAITPRSPTHSLGQSSFFLTPVDGPSNQTLLFSNNQSFLSSFQIHDRVSPTILTSTSMTNPNSAPPSASEREASLYEDDFIVRPRNP